MSIIEWSRGPVKALNTLAKFYVKTGDMEKASCKIAQGEKKREK